MDRHGVAGLGPAWLGGARKGRARKGKGFYMIDWEYEIGKFLGSKRSVRRILMGSPGSAQVTRCRLLQKFPGIDVATRGSTIVIRRA